MIALDFDGVLVDTRELALAAYAAARLELGLLALPALTQVTELGLIYRGPLSSSLTRWLDHPSAEAFWHRHAELCRSAEPIEPVIEALRPALHMLEAAGGYALVTGSHASRVLDSLRVAGCNPPARLVDRTDAGSKAEKLSRLKQQLPITHYVGDTRSDLLHAHEAGLLGVGVCYGYGAPDDLAEGPSQLLLNTPDECAAWIRTVVAREGGA